MIRSIAASALAALVTLAATPAFANPTDDVRSALMRYAGLSSYRMTMTAEKGGMTMDIVRPDSVHMSASGMELVKIGSTMYVKAPGGKGWMKQSVHGAGPAAVADKMKSMLNERDAFTATDLGMKAMHGGEPMHAYKVKQKNGSSSVIYVARDGFVHRMQSDNSTMEFSKFNQIAPIRAPI